MRVLVIVHGFPPFARGGSEIYAHEHAIALREYFGDEILVLTREQDPDRPEYAVRKEKRDGLDLVWVNNTFRQTRTFEDTYLNEAIGAIASRMIDEFAPDVAHIHHLSGLSTAIVGALAERDIPRFLTLHDYWLICHRGQLLDVNYQVCDGPEPTGCHSCLGLAGSVGAIGYVGAAVVRTMERQLPVARHFRRLAEQMATVVSSSQDMEGAARKRLEHMREVCADITHFIAPSRCMRDRFVRFGVAPERITVAGYGFDAAAFRGTVRTTSARLRLGFLGSLMVSKGPHVLLEAAARLTPGTVSVDLFGTYTAYHGDDSYRRMLEPLLGREGIHVRGPVAHDDVPQALASIDALVVPSVWPENSPLVIQEAFLAGVPVIASRIGGIPESVDHESNGLLFRAGDSEDLARTLRRLLDEPALLRTLHAGIPLVRTIEEDVRATRQLYQANQRAARTDRWERRRVAAVVLNYQSPDDTFLAVHSLLASERHVDEIIVVDNDTGAGARDALKEVWSRIAYVQTGSNLGFPGGMNVGIRQALARGADRVLLVNSDAIVPPDCILRLEECLDRTSGAGIAGPVVLARSHPDLISSIGMSYAASSGRMRQRGAGARIDTQALPAHPVVDAVSGCVMLVNRPVFDAIGLLDEDYFFGFEDLDFCLKARRAGFATVLARSAVAYHEGSRSIGAISPRRLYFAARNHLLMAERAAPSTRRLAFLGRASSIVLLNLAHALTSSGGSLPARLGAVARGTSDYVGRRFGAGS